MRSTPHISIVSPVYQAESCVAELCRRLKQSLCSITDSFEIILVEDRSPDNSWAAIEKEAQKDSRIRGVRLSRNFGQHRAITAGLDLAQGDWVVVMDCDLQDPPEAIPLLYARAKDGYQIVIAQFTDRIESGFRQATSRLFWAGLSWLAGADFDHRVGNFRIMSRKVVENFRSYREQLRLLGGLTNLMGFTTAYLPLKRGDRFSGNSSYTFRKLLAIAIDISMAYSDKPLRISIATGTIISGLSLTVGGIILLLGLGGLISVPGWASVMVSLYFLGGLIIANLGVIGYYVGKTFDEAKGRPLYIIESIAAEAAPTNTQNHALQKALGRVFWISGEPTIMDNTAFAGRLTAFLQEREIPTVFLKLDDIRQTFSHDRARSELTDVLKSDLELAQQYGYTCRVLTAQQLTVVISASKIYPTVTEWNRANLPSYFEIHLESSTASGNNKGAKYDVNRYKTELLFETSELEPTVKAQGDVDWIVDLSPNVDPQQLNKLFERLLNTSSQ